MYKESAWINYINYLRPLSCIHGLMKKKMMIIFKGASKFRERMKLLYFLVERCVGEIVEKGNECF
jgi:hypothetical protein